MCLYQCTILVVDLLNSYILQETSKGIECPIRDIVPYVTKNLWEIYRVAEKVKIGNNQSYIFIIMDNFSNPEKIQNSTIKNKAAGIV